MLAVAATTLVADVGATGVANSAASAASTPWVGRYVVGSSSVTDSSKHVWSKATGLSGGNVVYNKVTTQYTGSPGLYQHFAHGLKSWTLTLPVTGTFALDFLVGGTPSSSKAPVFNIDAYSGTTRKRLANAVSPKRSASATYPSHATASVTLTHKSVRFEFLPVSGVPDIEGLQMTEYFPSSLKGSTISDTFDGAANAKPDSRLVPTAGGGYEGTAGQEYYSTSVDNAHLDGHGHLALKAIRQDTTHDGTTYSWTSARLTTQRTFGVSYGRIAARVKAPPAIPGASAALWAKGTDEPSIGWPACGETDGMEFVGRAPTQIAGHGHMLGNSSDTTVGNGQHIASYGKNLASGTDTTANYHTYTVDYRPGSLTFSFDYKPFSVITQEDLKSGQTWAFTGRRFYLILNMPIEKSSWTGNIPDVKPGYTITTLVDSLVARPGSVPVSFSAT